MKPVDRRPTAEDILRDLGGQARLTVYLGYAPGTGKTHRLLTEARALRESGKRVALGWVETKGRPDLEALAEGLTRIPPRTARSGTATFEDFDLEAALAGDAEVVVLDELAHANLPGGRHVKRWEDAIALKSAGRAVIGALNIQHLETVAPTAEALIGFPVREIVPMSFLRAADQVVAVDASPDQIEERLREGRIVAIDDVQRALAGPFRPQTLRALRAILLQTIDEFARARGEADEVSTALALVGDDVDAAGVVAQAAMLADAMNLALEVGALDRGSRATAERLARTFGAHLRARGASDVLGPAALCDLPGSLLALPFGDAAKRILAGPIDRDVLVVDAERLAKE
ncbi:MAG TPA: hypothetical protein VEJ20_07540, partial [Candidatus Eremiobacteraceae bacterium]|nr:hypothetical protein [Candidatus Eremiobacteraceae bacterium]